MSLRNWKTRGALALLSVSASCSLIACGKLADGPDPNGIGDGFIEANDEPPNATVNSALPADSTSPVAAASTPDAGVVPAEAGASGVEPADVSAAPNAAVPAPYVADLTVHDQEISYVATLSTGQETPPNGAPSRGSVQLIVDASRTRFRYHVESTMSAALAAHIARGIATVPGTDLHLLPLAPSTDGTDVFAPGEERELARGRWYVNLTSAAYPRGEIRGQLLLPGETLYSAVLSAANEVPAVASTATGNVQLVLSADRNTVRYEAAFFNVEPTFAQIAEDTNNALGPVIYPLTLLPEYTETPNSSAGAAGVRGVTAQDLAALNAGTWYVNARSSAFPSGAARGQLNRADQ